MPATQYDSIGASYSAMKSLPIQETQHRALHAAIAPHLLSHPPVLDLATGTGFYARKLLAWGARHVHAVDISPAMIAAAAADTPPALAGALDLHVADCAKPGLLPALGLAEKQGTFPLVLAAWLLNYAPDGAILAGMLRNVHAALAPGGTFAALTSNPHILHLFGPGRDIDEVHIGTTVRVLRAVPGGYQVRCTGHVQPRAVEFDYFWLDEGTYRGAAETAGLVDVEFKPALPDEEMLERMGAEWWAAYIRRPKAAVVTMRKPA